MRTRTRISKASGAAAELTNIEVEEVSVVNAAANKRTFLVVKSADAKGIKSGLVDALKGALASFAEITTDVAKLADDATELPADLTAKIVKLVDSLTPAPVAKTEKTEPVVTPAPAATAVDKAGAKISTARLARLEAALTASDSARAELQAVLAEVRPAAETEVEETSTEKTKTPAAAVVTETKKELDPELLAALGDVATTLKAMGEKIVAQDAVIAGLKKEAPAVTRGASNQGDPAPVVKAATSEVSWPLDMNREITRGNTPVEKSFFA